MAKKDVPVEDPTKAIVRGVIVAVVALIGIIFLFSAIYTVKSGQEGVLLTFGKASPNAIQPGLHFKVPIVQQVVKFDIRTQKYGITALQGGDSQGNPATGGSLESASSSDMQIVSLQMVVNYRIATGTTPKLWSTVGAGYEDNVIQPAVHEATKAAVAQFSAADLIGKREEVRAKIEELLKAKLVQYSIVVEQVSIVNLDFSKQFNDAIEAKVTAEQLKDKAVNDLARIQVEAQQRVADAQGQRDAAIAAAEGQAKATMLTAEADAKKVELINEQLARSPQYIEYIKASRWSGNYPDVYMTGGNAPNLLMQLPSTGAVSASS
jgi:regulator of protease activity HflC (stomatin/prohibitin superfamily)